MTRPRISGAEVSWQVELAVAMKVMLAAPTATIIILSAIRLGAAAATVMVMPKTRQLPASSLGVGANRDAVARAPTKAPAPINAVSDPYVPASPWNGNLASTGSTTLKLKARVPTTASSRRVRRSSVLVQT